MAAKPKASPMNMSSIPPPLTYCCCAMRLCSKTPPTKTMSNPASNSPLPTNTTTPSTPAAIPPTSSHPASWDGMFTNTTPTPYFGKTGQPWASTSSRCKAAASSLNSPPTTVHKPDTSATPISPSPATGNTSAPVPAATPTATTSPPPRASATAGTTSIART